MERWLIRTGWLLVVPGLLLLGLDFMLIEFLDWLSRGFSSSPSPHAYVRVVPADASGALIQMAAQALAVMGLGLVISGCWLRFRRPK
ncbi:hypothetical protein C0V76_01105 [Uliginosibacterium sp. TH139]|nr:hypothetical protein C0V76_01105 [Uliginosibacterium sp. TH139]